MQFNDLFGIHAQALVLRGQRARLLATNLANADTPRYLARDVDFKSLLAGTATGNLSLATTSRKHIGADTDVPAEGDKLYRIPSQPSLDGNTVDPQIEQAEFAKNELQYEASLRMLNGRISSLLLALRGE